MFIFILVLIILLLVDFVGSVEFELCDSAKVYCVELVPSTCADCDGSSLQGVVDLLDSSGGFTIYLVGKSGMEVSFDESVVIDGFTPDDILLANVIQPYPNHSIVWKNSGDNVNVDINAYWWKITGDGGSLRFENPNTLTITKEIISVSRGSFLTNFVLNNTLYGLDSMIALGECIDSNFKGFLLEELSFLGKYSDAAIFSQCYCTNCGSNTFVDNCGSDSRLLIRKNHFEKDISFYIYGYPLTGTIESNYFKSTILVNVFMLFYWRALTGINIYNNVFDIPTGTTADVIILCYYQKVGDVATNGKNLFFNNLIIDETGQLDSLMEYQRWSDNGLPDPFYVYNNLIDSPTKCYSAVKCGGSMDYSANILVMYNHQTKPGCSDSWDSSFSTCNITNSHIVMGNNTAGPVNFVGEGDVPYPYYDLDQFLDGMSHPTSPPYVLPDHDFEGRARRFCGSVNRTTIGPFEYYHDQIVVPLCEGEKVFCVEVNSSFPCCNCRYTTIQGVIDFLDDMPTNIGGYTIYLVGRPNNVEVSFEESVSIDVSTPEDILLANVIQPYPNHTIIWQNSGDETNLVIQLWWWKITGDGGYLRFENPNTVSDSKEMIIASYGVLLTNFVIQNYHADLDEMIYLTQCTGLNWKGNLVEGLSFRGLPTISAIRSHCWCTTCSSTSFIDEYGSDSRSLVRKNHFEMSGGSFIYGGPLSGTIESNYIKKTVGGTGNSFILYYWTAMVGARIFNNIFEVSSGTSSIVECNYQDKTTYGKNLFFNNLIIDESGQLDALFSYQEWGSSTYLPEEFIAYNNLIISPTKCSPIVDCDNDESVANVKYLYNHQTKLGCSGSWNSSLSTCNVTASQLVNLGNNSVGPVDIIGEGDSPYPYYEIDDVLFGMEFPVSPPYVLPDFDYRGRVRPSRCRVSGNRTTIGAFEYYFGDSVYPLCEGDKVFCVEVNKSSSPCCNCHSTSIQEVVNSLDSSGNYTIYLVGRAGVDVFFEENVVIQITVGTPENFSLANVIQPYPDHSIIWQNSGDETNLLIDSLWWKITGDGGYLRFENPNTVTTSTSIIAVYYGAILTNFVVTNFLVNSKMILLAQCSGTNFKGFLIERLSFYGEYTNKCIYSICWCTTCESTSFVDEYGSDNRLLIRKNLFELPGASIYGYPLSGTVERNYFKATTSGTQFIILYWQKSQDGVRIYNNIFHVPPGRVVDEVIACYYNKEGDLVSTGKNLFFNNHIIDETGQLNSLFLYHRLDANDQSALPDPFYVYNNLIVRPNHCSSIVKCNNDESVVNMFYRSNHQTKPGCDDSWDNGLMSSCNSTGSSFVDGGSNTVGPVDFVGGGDVPYPYYDLDQILHGMTFPSNPLYPLPDHDYEGRARPACKISKNKTMIGAFEYYLDRQSFPLCDEEDVFCVGVNSSFPCCNCHSATIQEVVNDLDSSGGYTIYLVGSSLSIVSFEESVVISGVSTPENISLANVIQPYPGHSIIWRNSGNNENLVITTSIWWKVTGNGGTLKLENPTVVTASKAMVRIQYGGLFTNFEMVNHLNGLEKFIDMNGCSGNDFKGFLYESLVFSGSPGSVVDYAMKSFCSCGASCPMNSFVKKFGSDNRLLIRKNHFEVRTATSFFYGHTLSATFESNYFKVIQDLNFVFNLQTNNVLDGIKIYNNVIHVLPGTDCDHLVAYGYQKEGDVPSFGKNLVYNNHIIVEDTGNMITMFRYQRNDVGDKSSLPDPFYVYNNLIIRSDFCTPIVECVSDENAVNMFYQYNHQTKSDCSTKWDKQLIITCNVTGSNFVNLGNNNAGPISIKGQGDLPFPYYDLKADIVGLAFDNLIPPYVLPEDDFSGNVRPGPDALQRTTIGASEYICPSQCLGAGRISCQNSSDCGCVNPYFGTYSCQYSECECFRGNCSSPDPLTGMHVCTCEEHYFGSLCNNTKCYGIWNNDTSVCNGHGKCNVRNNCTCYQNYTLFPGNYDPETDLSGEDVCSHWNCFGTYRFDESVCNGHGNCSDSNVCDCGKNYNSTSDCGRWKCFGEDKDDLEKVCSGHGVCASFDKCVCSTTDYTGEKCNVFTCHNISRESDDACGVYGTCTDIDKCKCNPGYSSSSDNSPCDSWSCFLVNKDIKTSVCNNRGTCDAPNICTCKNKFEGDNCETFSCGFDHKNAAACSGHGKCTDPEICDCDFGYSGVLCQTNDMYLTIMTPVLATSGFIFGIFLFICMICVICVLCVCMAMICVAMLIVGGLYTTNRIQKLRMRKFSKLRNVDLILREQELDADVSIAHLRINRNLFEISFDEIKTERILGEGGSNSVVFKANWNGLIVAFKCFKTRQLMSNQDKFDEFEREVEILSSLAHPNIIRFFGATMKPPRIGIVMEYASNGEMLEYMNKFKEMSGSSYPVFQKIRMFSQVAKAMDFLHSRNIIHRDLKSENVLIDSEETCKLMDFGLSRLVDRMSVAKTSRVGTDCYMSPEIVTSSNYSEKCDVYSFSILMFIVLTEDPKPYGQDAFQVEIKAANNSSYRPAMSKLDFIDSKKFGWLKKMIIKCWSHSPKDRDSFKKLRIKLEQGDDHQEQDDDDETSSEVTKSGGYENLSKIETVRLLNVKDKDLEMKDKELKKLRERVKMLEEKYENVKESDSSEEEESDERSKEELDDW